MVTELAELTQTGGSTDWGVTLTPQAAGCWKGRSCRPSFGSPSPRCC